MHYIATIRSNWLNEGVLTLWSQFILLWASGKTANTSGTVNKCLRLQISVDCGLSSQNNIVSSRTNYIEASRSN